MDINAPLHQFIRLWAVGALIAAGYLAVLANKTAVRRNRKATNRILALLLLAYGIGYAYLCFFYRTAMEEVHIRLEPFWSYREAFGRDGIRRLGVARSILLNILIMIPPGYLLPAVYRASAHPYRYAMITILALSVGTELLQAVGKVGLCETDDVIDNVLGGAAGLAMYLAADKITGRVNKR